jgi:hypothetical protein
MTGNTQLPPEEEEDSDMLSAADVEVPECLLKPYRSLKLPEGLLRRVAAAVGTIESGWDSGQGDEPEENLEDQRCIIDFLNEKSTFKLLAARFKKADAKRET